MNAAEFMATVRTRRDDGPLYTCRDNHPPMAVEQWDGQKWIVSRQEWNGERYVEVARG